MTRSIFCASPGKRNRARRNARSATSSGAPAKSNPDANADAVSRAAPSSAPRNSPTEDSSRRPARSSERRNAARTSASSLGAAPVSATRFGGVVEAEGFESNLETAEAIEALRAPAAPNRADSEGDEPAEVWPVSSPSEPSRSRIRGKRGVGSVDAFPLPIAVRFPPPAPLVRPPARSSSPLACQALRLCTTLTTHCVAPSRALRLRDAAVRGGPRERGHHSLRTRSGTRTARRSRSSRTGQPKPAGRRRADAPNATPRARNEAKRPPNRRRRRWSRRRRTGPARAGRARRRGITRRSQPYSSPLARSTSCANAAEASGEVRRRRPRRRARRRRRRRRPPNEKKPPLFSNEKTLSPALGFGFLSEMEPLGGALLGVRLPRGAPRARASSPGAELVPKVLGAARAAEHRDAQRRREPIPQRREPPRRARTLEELPDEIHRRRRGGRRRRVSPCAPSPPPAASRARRVAQRVQNQERVRRGTRGVRRSVTPD